MLIGRVQGGGGQLSGSIVKLAAPVVTLRASPAGQPKLWERVSCVNITRAARVLPHASYLSWPFLPYVITTNNNKKKSHTLPQPPN